jgi:8-oxo-dGTP diphosphatase
MTDFLRVKSPISSDDLYGYEYPKPSLTATVVLYDFCTNNILLVKRKEEPEKDKWAFPGGFLDVYKETIEDTACREVREETGIHLKKMI